jgi:copper chaperone CopZ
MNRLIIILFLALATSASAQDAKKTALLEVRTSSVCDMCEKTIEENLIYEKGVKKVDLDLATSIIRIEYDARKTTPDAIRVAVTNLGYSADELPGDAKAFSKLPACCQKEGCGKPMQKH